MSPLPPLQEDGQQPEPVTGRREHDVPDAERGERVGDGAALVGGRGREAGAQLRIAGIDPELPPGLRVDAPELTGVWKLLLSGIADLDGDDVVAAGQVEKRTAPVERPPEVRDDDDECALPRERGGPSERLSERRR